MGVLNRTSSFSPLGGVSDVLNLGHYPFGGIGIWLKADLGYRQRHHSNVPQRPLRLSSQCNIYSHFECTLTTSKRESRHAVCRLSGHQGRQGLRSTEAAPPSSEVGLSEPGAQSLGSESYHMAGPLLFLLGRDSSSGKGRRMQDRGCWRVHSAVFSAGVLFM
jgi:hypothetical protein